MLKSYVKRNSRLHKRFEKGLIEYDDVIILMCLKEGIIANIQHQKTMIDLEIEENRPDEVKRHQKILDNLEEYLVALQKEIPL